MQGSGSHPWLSAVSDVGAQRLPSSHSKPSSHGMGSQRPSALHRSPLLHEVEVQAAKHPTEKYEQWQGAGTGWHMVPAGQSESDAQPTPG